jgi:glutamine synthetase adenylyltransferase
MNHFTTKTVSVLDTFAELWKVTVSFDMSVRPSGPTGRMFMKFGYFSKIFRENASFITILQQ